MVTGRVVTLLLLLASVVGLAALESVIGIPAVTLLVTSLLYKRLERPERISLFVVVTVSLATLFLMSLGVVAALCAGLFIAQIFAGSFQSYIVSIFLNSGLVVATAVLFALLAGVAFTYGLLLYCLLTSGIITLVLNKVTRGVLLQLTRERVLLFK